MPDPFENTLSEVCEEAARAAGRHALDNLDRRRETAAVFAHDVKLVLDIECQRIAEEVIHRHFPEHAILGEEGATARNHAVEWIIDPIDGTANFTHGLPFWCASVAVRRDSEVLAGCVFVPAADECYTATAGGPALCNGRPVQASATARLSDAIVFTGLTKDIDERAIRLFGAAARTAHKVRILGTAALDICHVACGRSDAFFEAGLYLWDVAAAGLIAERAGALCTAWPRSEEHGVRFLCTAPALHAAARELVETFFTD